ncbi:hypothetical protein OIDMADRAFT_17223 [Oidiodendron maius Zn]|uniref:ABM domain-containing protein n=1 Tax=Oidiodendron maius (strain Zn) TaxID=913774 RepID=A0A0C3D4M4_OIDMZ|nr:hypothetical protein OIDMADRAFT_17223 [Oidiodendron maius Zn]
MASPIYLVAIITPKPGKADKVLELLQTHSEFVKKNEPGTLKYEINVDTKPSGVKEIVVVEIYQDKPAFNSHVSSEEMKVFQKTLLDGDMLDGPMQLKRVKTVGGFSSRM